MNGEVMVVQLGVIPHKLSANECFKEQHPPFCSSTECAFNPSPCQKVLLHSINGHLRSSLFYDYLLVSDVLDINDLLDTRSLGMYSACMAPHFPALLCSVYRHCSFPRCYISHCVCPSLNCVFPTALCCAQITSVVSNRL